MVQEKDTEIKLSTVENKTEYAIKGRKMRKLLKKSLDTSDGSEREREGKGCKLFHTERQRY